MPEMCSDLQEGGFGGFETFPYMADRSDELPAPIGESDKTTKTTFSQVNTCTRRDLRKCQQDSNIGDANE